MCKQMGAKATNYEKRSILPEALLFFSVVVLVVVSLLIVLGNTGFPIALRYIIVCIHRFKEKSRKKKGDYFYYRQNSSTNTPFVSPPSSTHITPRVSIDNTHLVFPATGALEITSSNKSYNSSNNSSSTNVSDGSSKNSSVFSSTNSFMKKRLAADYTARSTMDIRSAFSVTSQDGVRSHQEIKPQVLVFFLFISSFIFRLFAFFLSLI